MKVTKLTAQEAKDIVINATLSPIESKEVHVATFPPAGDGFSHCDNNLCYVACGGRWLRLVDGNGNQFNCGSGNGKYFNCSGSTYVCSC